MIYYQNLISIINLLLFLLIIIDYFNLLIAYH